MKEYTDTGKLAVLAEQCGTCIFRPGNLMHLRPGRVASMVAECYSKQLFIMCHETMESDNTDDEDNATGPICRGFYDAHGHISQKVRIFGRLDAIAFVANDRPI